MSAHVTIKGAEQVIARFARVSSHARAKMRQTVWKLGIMLAAYVQRNKLSGQVLNQRSGRLISSIHDELIDSPNEVRTEVGTNVEYGAIHEYGFQGTQEVRAHNRSIKEAWGRPITPRDVMVAAHTRRVDMPMRAFLRPSLAEFAPQVTVEMNNLRDELAREANR